MKKRARPEPVKVTVGNVCLGDPVCDRTTSTWFTVEKLTRVDGVLYVEGTSTSVLAGHPHVRARAEDCTLCWNPRRWCYGRALGERRKRFWEP